MRIWKYVLNFEREQLVTMPSISEIMDIQMQRGVPVMWALVDPSAEEIEVRIVVHGTGYDIDEVPYRNEYLGTVQDGDLVWHFFMSSEG